MSATAFTPIVQNGKLYARESEMDLLDAQAFMRVSCRAGRDEVDLSYSRGGTYLAYRITAAQARALGHELLAMAVAVESARGACGTGNIAAGPAA